MKTMQPCVTIGSYTWAQDRLPSDEFSVRLDDLRGAMVRHGWRAVLAYGDVREHAALAYLSNFIPRVRWGMALLPASGDARLLCAMSTRDLPAMRGLTWIADVRSGMGPEWDKAFAPWFERFGALPPYPPPRAGEGREGDQQLGTLGFDLMAPVLHDAVRRSLGERFVLQRADDVFAVPPQRKRPRELTLLRASCALAQGAARMFADNWRESSEPETAALAAERAARARAAQDVRTLISLDGGRTLSPYQGRFDKAAGPLVGYLAVKLMGYWADLFVTLEDGAPKNPARRRVEVALDALIAALRPGVRAGDLHATAVAALAPVSLHPTLSGSVGHGIGLSLHEAPELRDDADATLVEDGVYALQVGIADADAGNVLLSAMVRNAKGGAEVLLRSPQ
jgi:Xaa-Pro aminopeptidase